MRTAVFVSALAQPERSFDDLYAINNKAFYQPYGGMLATLSKEYELRHMSWDMAIEKDPDICVLHITGTIMGKHLISLIENSRNLLTITDFYTSSHRYLLDQLSKHSNNIIGYLARFPFEASWFETMTGIKSILAPSPINVDVAGDILFDQKEGALVIGIPGERAGLFGYAMRKANQNKYNFDTIRRSKLELDNIFPDLEHCENLPYAEFLLKARHYKFIIDLSEPHNFHDGRSGIDALQIGSLFIGFKDNSYASYLYDDLAIQVPGDLLDYKKFNVDVEEHWSRAKDRVVSRDVIRANILSLCS